MVYFPRTERELLLDHFHDTTIDLRGNHATAQIRLGGADVPTVDRIKLFVVMPAHTDPQDAHVHHLDIRGWPRLEGDGQRGRWTTSFSRPLPARPDPRRAAFLPILHQSAAALAKAVTTSSHARMSNAPEGPFGVGWRNRRDRVLRGRQARPDRRPVQLHQRLDGRRT